MIYLDASYNVIVGQVAECMECHAFFAGIPAGFIYDDPEAGWRQDYTAEYVVGYCKPCATDISAAHHEDYVNGNWEARTIEDEAHVWMR